MRQRRLTFMFVLFLFFILEWVNTYRIKSVHHTGFEAPAIFSAKVEASEAAYGFSRSSDFIIFSSLDLHTTFLCFSFRTL